MQLQDMVGRVRKTLGEPEPNGYGSQQAGQGTWDNTQIIGYINEAMGQLAHYWRKQVTGTLKVTSVGQTNFDIPADAIEDGIRTISYVSGGIPYPIKYVDLSQYNDYATGVTPVYYATGQVINAVYTVWAGQILLWPGAVSTSDTLQPYYYRVPATLVNGPDTPEIPSRFHVAAVFYAIRECQMAVEESALAQDADRKWQSMFAQFRSEMARNQRDRGITVRGRK